MLKNTFAASQMRRRALVSARILGLAAAVPGAAEAGTKVFTPNGAGPNGSLQAYVVPTTGIYDITAFGAHGGLGTFFTLSGIRSAAARAPRSAAILRSRPGRR